MVPRKENVGISFVFLKRTLTLRYGQGEGKRKAIEWEERSDHTLIKQPSTHGISGKSRQTGRSHRPSLTLGTEKVALEGRQGDRTSPQRPHQVPRPAPQGRYVCWWKPLSENCYELHCTVLPRVGRNIFENTLNRDKN